MSLQKSTYNLVNRNKNVETFLYVLIILNVFAVIIESVEEYGDSYEIYFNYFEIFAVFIFAFEYFIRIWTAGFPKISGNRTKEKFQYILSPLGLIDLVAILPFILPLVIPFDLRAVKMLRLFRLLRIFKLERYSKSFQTIRDVIKETRTELVITLFVAFTLLLLSSILMYYVESAAQVEKFASIGHSFWWAVATLTGVGYGDVFPITFWGKVLSAIIAIIGIGFIALPTGIISSAFIEKVQEQKLQVKANINCCPNCGNKISI